MYFFHHGFAPDGLTLSAGGLAATSLKADHSAFCVLLMRSFLYIRAVVHMKPGFVPRLWEHLQLIFGNFFLRMQSQLVLMTQSYSWFSFKTYYRD